MTHYISGETDMIGPPDVFDDIKHKKQAMLISFDLHIHLARSE
jgi:hypothetical protein